MDVLQEYKVEISVKFMSYLRQSQVIVMCPVFLLDWRKEIPKETNTPKYSRTPQQNSKFFNDKIIILELLQNLIICYTNIYLPDFLRLEIRIASK